MWAMVRVGVSGRVVQSPCCSFLCAILDAPGALLLSFVMKLGGRHVSLPSLLWLSFVCALTVPKLLQLYGSEMQKQMVVRQYATLLPGITLHT